MGKYGGWVVLKVERVLFEHSKDPSKCDTREKIKQV
jgi:hypothetical protein